MYSFYIFINSFIKNFIYCFLYNYSYLFYYSCSYNYNYYLYNNFFYNFVLLYIPVCMCIVSEAGLEYIYNYYIISECVILNINFFVQHDRKE